jgi:hypothetical protein
MSVAPEEPSMSYGASIASLIPPSLGTLSSRLPALLLGRRRRTRYRSSRDTRNLVFSSVGDTSIHRQWLEGSNRNFDLFLCYYGDRGSRFEDDADLYLRRQGTKTENFVYAYRKWRKRLKGYDNFFIVDDDIAMDTAGLNEMFGLFDDYGLWLAQPAYRSGSDVRWPISAQATGTVLRYTNFVETGVTLFRRSALDRAIDVMAESRSGFGVDQVYSQVLSDPTDKIAILDGTPCTHPYRERSEMDQVMDRWDQRKEGRALLQRWRAGKKLEAVEYGRVSAGPRVGEPGPVAPDETPAR